MAESRDATLAATGIGYAEARGLRVALSPYLFRSMMVGMARGQLQKNSALSNLCEGVEPAGEETVEVPAGSFKTTKLHNSKYESDAWVSTKVPFYMVKMTGKDYDLQLAGMGDGAKSSITETPQEMPGMGEPKKKSE